MKHDLMNAKISAHDVAKGLVANAAPSVTADHSLLAPHEKEEKVRETRPLG
jgi:hypothetical protein